LDDGTYTIQLTVEDIHGAFDTETKVVTVGNIAPTVTAGANKTVDEGTPVGLGTDLFGKNLILSADAESGLANWTVAGGFQTTNYRIPVVGQNPDGIIHARVTDVGSGTFRVGFEDTLGGGDLDYNDILFDVTGAVSDPPTGGVGASLIAGVGSSITVNIVPPVVPAAAVQVTSGFLSACGLYADGIVDCWGSDSQGKSSPYVSQGGTVPDGTTFSQIDSSSFSTCGVLLVSGTVECWGDPFNGVTSPLPGVFTQVSTSANYTCGIRVGGLVECWGQTGTAGAPPAVPFDQISSGLFQSCGIRSADDKIQCWGSSGSLGTFPPTASTYSNVSVGQGYACAVRIGSGTIDCWGENDEGQTSPPAGNFSRVTSGDEHACAVLAGGGVSCWGNNDFGQTSPPLGVFLSSVGSISASVRHTCGILSSPDRFKCWGNDTSGESSPPIPPIDAQIWLGPPFQPGSIFVGDSDTASTFGPHAVSSGANLDFHVKLDTDGTVFTIGKPPSVLPAVPFSQVETGFAHTCALKLDNTVECWGAEINPLFPGFDPGFGQATPPIGTTFSQITTGDFHTCGILSVGDTVVCWGNDVVGQSSPPLGVAFSQISAGSAITCGILKTGSSIVCWGETFSEFDFSVFPAVEVFFPPPGGTFDQIDIGFNHGCGIHPGGLAECWGSDLSERSSPYVLNGGTIANGTTFNQVTAGGNYSCGILSSNGSIVCWGSASNDVLVVPTGGFAYSDLSSNNLLNCAVRTVSGLVDCWGTNNAGQTLPPAIAFSQVSANTPHACGLKTDGSLDCWGSNSFGAVAPDFSAETFGEQDSGFPLTISPGGPNRGTSFFYGGGQTPSSGTQVIDVSSGAPQIDSGGATFILSGYLGGSSGQVDSASLTAIFWSVTGGSGTNLGNGTTGQINSSNVSNRTGLVRRIVSGLVPSGTRSIEFVAAMDSSPLHGSRNDGYVDSVSLVLIAVGQGSYSDPGIVDTHTATLPQLTGVMASPVIPPPTLSAVCLE
jgi:alpha-tubulin suppressor-like RCC1 family protein